MEEETRELEKTGKVMLCRGCYAEVAVSSGIAVCLACGGALAVRAGLDSADLPARRVDRRGILMPRRHAVGGVITPR